MGEVPEDFGLNDQYGKEFRLSQTKGKRVLLSFHPLAWTPACKGQMLSLEEHSAEFGNLNTVAVGISVDSLQSKRAWVENIGIQKTRLLADFWPHGKVAQQFGIFREKNGISERANILLDESHRMVFFRLYPIHSVPDIREVLAVIGSLDATGKM
ncbi:redoxin domain-containing protein [Methanoregula sp.]|uniref:redoxin domain-containing protein n=1 Tax=Methanoregula sp. TaxID=2052170 RepID=UPI0025D67C12|nr:redoxin domain-containing protein [Methanoregula sp.]